MANYTVFHLHTDYSNGSMMDATSKPLDYILKAKECGMTSLAFSEHGNVFNWIEKKMLCDKHGISYIHGAEFYVTTTLDERRREAFHMGMYARNWEGVKEINRLSSLSYNKDDNHRYYKPRVSIDEVMATSDDVIVTTACLASILRTESDDVTRFIDWLTLNRHRAFLEIQYHTHPEQLEYNRFLYSLSQRTGIPLIAASDTHALNDKRAKLRLVLQKAKNIDFGHEEHFDLTFKSYEEFVEMFRKQNLLPMDVVLEAIENTNRFADMIEPFELDTSHKYPMLYANPEAELQSRINRGVVERGLDKWEPTKRDQYFERIVEEYNVITGMDASSYFLLLDDIIAYCKQNGIGTSPRGSCNGSLMLWALGNTDIDSVKYGLPFFRFLSNARVSMADVDIDLSGKRRDEVKDFLYNYEGIRGSAIITYGTYGLKGAVREVGRGLGIPLDIVDTIAKDIDEIEEEDESGEIKYVTTFHNKDKWYEEYPELMDLAHETLGLIFSAGVHACGFLTTDRDIESDIGTFQSDTSRWPISQNNMKCIDATNYVKMDLLVVDNVQMVDDVCELAGIPHLRNDEMDFEDDNVWREMLKSGLGIFQFERTGAHFLKESLLHYNKVRQISSDTTRLDLMTALNGIIRPAGDSIRDDFVKGIPHDNGMVELNQFLSKTIGYLIYQEAIMMFLHHFCGYDMGKSDNVRRGIAKKYGTEHLIPEIKQAFMDYCTQHYPHYTPEHLSIVADRILKVIEDASDYGFSENHSRPYSILGYKGAYLRHYYPLEFLTVQLIINEGKIEKTAKIIDYIKTHTNIRVMPIQFRKSRATYFLSRDDNAIYKGIKSIKFLNDLVAEELYTMRDNQYDTFTDLLVDITENTSVNTRQLDILIRLNFFAEYGGNQLLSDIYAEFASRYKKTYVDKTKQKRLAELYEIESTLRADATRQPHLPMQEQLLFEKEHLGYISSTFPTVADDYAAVLDVNSKYTPRLTLYMLRTGEERVCKVAKKNMGTIKPGVMIRANKVEQRPRKTRDASGRWIDLAETESWLVGFSVVV